MYGPGCCGHSITNAQLAAFKAKLFKGPDGNWYRRDDANPPKMEAAA
ncbi:MAG: hypothetical protein KGL39_28195 [Patescibacteria group bacterium]|nr:hypothetical protein [Patescibacteria group bacterium]